MNDKNGTGSTKDIRDKLLSTVNACDDMIQNSELTVGQRIQAVHALNTVAKTYLEVDKQAKTEERFPEIY